MFARALLALSLLTIASVASSQTAPRPANNADGPAPPSGTTLQYAFRMGAGGTDNVERTTTDAASESLALSQLDFALDTVTNRIKADATANLSYLKYLEGTYDNDLVGRVDGFGRFALVQDHFFWAVQEDFGQALVDRMAALTPTNSENINYFSTGPDVTFDVSSTNFVTLNARYANVTYEVSPFDGDRYGGGLTFGHRLGAGSTISLNADFKRFLFDDQVTNNNYDRTTAYVRYEAQGRRTTISANVGASQVNENGAKDASPLVQFEMVRKISAASTLTLYGGIQSTDAADSFRNKEAGAAGSGMAEPEQGTAEAYDRTYYGFLWNYVHNRSALDLSWRRDDDTYNDPTSDLDVIRDDFQLALSRDMQANLRLSLLYWLVRLDYPERDFVDNQTRLALAATWRFARALGVVLDVEHIERNPSGSATGFRENRVFLSVEYRGK